MSYWGDGDGEGGSRDVTASASDVARLPYTSSNLPLSVKFLPSSSHPFPELLNDYEYLMESVGH